MGTQRFIFFPEWNSLLTVVQTAIPYALAFANKNLYPFRDMLVGRSRMLSFVLKTQALLRTCAWGEKNAGKHWREG